MKLKLPKVDRIEAMLYFLMVVVLIYSTYMLGSLLSFRMSSTLAYLWGFAIGTIIDDVIFWAKVYNGKNIQLFKRKV